MTRPTKEALAFRAQIEKEWPDWPPELRQAATNLRMELDFMRTKAWKQPGALCRAQGEEVGGNHVATNGNCAEGRSPRLGIPL
jgi:hypothetical protein